MIVISAFDSAGVLDKYWDETGLRTILLSPLPPKSDDIYLNFFPANTIFLNYLAYLYALLAYPPEFSKGRFGQTSASRSTRLHGAHYNNVL